MSLGAMQEKMIAKQEKMPQGSETKQTLCQRLACIADKLEMSAKVSFWKKEYNEAITYYQLLLKAGKSEFDDLYNLACCYGRTGDDKKASKFLKLAVDGGFAEIDHIRTDPDFDNVRNSPKFQKAMNEISQKLEGTTVEAQEQAEDIPVAENRVAKAKAINN